jgi:DNA-binding transcriptional LysR family regulator
MDLDLEALATLVAVMDRGTLSAAARSQRLSANAVSQRIARLERQLGAQLLVRSTRVVRPTDVGLRVAERARKVLGECDELLAVVTPQALSLRGVVRVGLAPDLTRAFDWTALARLLATHEGLRLELAARAREVDLVAAGIDLAVWVGPLPARAFVVKRLGVLDWHLAAAPAYIAAHGAPRTLAELSEHACLLAFAPRRETHWRLLDERGREHEVPVQGRFESDSGEVLHAALLGGMGIGMRPRRELARLARAGTLVRVLPRYRFQPMPVALLAPEGRLRVARVRAVADYLGEVLASEMAGGDEPAAVKRTSRVSK